MIILKLLRKVKFLTKFNFSRKIHYFNSEFKIPFINGLGFENYILASDWLDDLINAFCNSKNDYFVDVGVNVGQTLLKVKAVDSQIKYLGFEPNPACCYYCSKLIDANHFKGVEIIHSALFDKIGKFSLEKEYDYDARASMISNLRPGLFTKKETVVGFDFDLFFQNEIVTFIKIDVEGAEYEVLSGMTKSLRTHRPIVVCEVLDSHTEQVLSFTQERANNVADLILSIEYDIIKMETDPITKRIKNINKISEITIKQWSDESAYSNDYIFVPKEKTKYLIEQIKAL